MTNEALNEGTGRLASRWTRLASLSLLLSSAGALTLVVAILGFGVKTEGEQWFVLIFTMVPLIGAVLVNGREWWWKIAGIVTGLFTAMGLIWTAFGLTRPASFFDFVPATLVVPGALIGLGASVAAIVRRNRLTASDEKPERTWIRGMLVAVAVLVGASSLFTVAAKRTVDSSEASAGVRLRDFEFDRPAYDLLGASTVYVRNDDPFFHTFTVDELGIDVGLNPGSQALIRIPARPGNYLLYCRPHANKDDPVDKGMSARLRVL
jgi:hypothetical protein